MKGFALVLGFAAAVCGCATEGGKAAPPPHKPAPTPTRKAVGVVESQGSAPDATTTGPRTGVIEEPAGPTATADVGGGRRHALIIGVSRYASKEIPAIPLVRADAQAIYSRFTDEAGLDIAERDVKVLLDEAATREAILHELIELNKRVGPDDTVLIYYAGHGTMDVGPKGEVLGNYLVPYDARLVSPDRVDPRTGIAIVELQEKLQSNNARDLLLALDTCFSGSAGRGLNRVPQPQTNEKDLEALKDAAAGWAVLTATAPNQPALEVPELGHGLFTYALLEALNADADHDGRVTILEMFTYLQNLVKAEAAKRGVVQTPLLKFSGQDFKLRDVRARHKVNLVVTYDDGHAPRDVVGRADAPAAPIEIAEARRFAVRVEAWDQPTPLRVYVLRIAVTPRGPVSAMLIPDGVNQRPPPVTVADGRAAAFPVPEETGRGAEPVPDGERDAHVVYVAFASEARIPLAAVVEIERRLVEAAAKAAPENLAREIAARIRAEDVLKQAAIRYVFAKQGQGGGARP